MEAFISNIGVLFANYGQFFSWDAIHSVITDPVSLGIIFWLIVLEGLLSCDNALVLAVLVRGLPQSQQKKALLYGIWGAYFFRFLAIGMGTFLVRFKWIQILGSLYLLWMAAKFFLSSSGGDGNDDAEANVSSFWVKILGSFWATVLTVELMDISFSVDSILAAFAMSDKVWVLFMGGMIGILMMRGVAGVFIKLLEKYPKLESAAYVLIALIGAKLMGQAFGFHIAHVIFFSVMASVVLGTIALQHFGEREKTA